MPQNDDKNLSKEFAELLYLSSIAEEFKEELIELLPQLNKSQINEIYKALEKEDSQRKLLELELDTKLKNLKKKKK